MNKLELNLNVTDKHICMVLTRKFCYGSDSCLIKTVTLKQQ